MILYHPACTYGMRKVGPSADWCNPAWALSNGRVLFEEDNGTYTVLRPLYDLWEEYVGTDVLATYPDMEAVDAAFLSDTL